MKTILLWLILASSLFPQTSSQKWMVLERRHGTSFHFALNGSGTTGNIVMQGTGTITVQWGDSTYTVYNLTGSDNNISHTYTYGIVHYVSIDKPLLIKKWSMTSNPIGITFNTLGLKNLTSLNLASLNTGTVALTVNTANCTGLTSLNLASLNTGTVALTVNTANCTGLTYLNLNTLNTGTVNLTVNTANCTGLTYLNLNILNTGTVALTVNTANCTGLTSLNLTSLNTGTVNLTVNTANCTGLVTLQLYNLNTGTVALTVNTANCTGLTSLNLNTLNTGIVNLTYTTHTWSNSVNYVYVGNTIATLSSSGVDSWFNDLANATWTGSGKVARLTGSGIGIPTSASLTARTVTLPSKSVSVFNN